MPPSRAERRRADKSRAKSRMGRPASLADLRAAVAAVRVPGMPRAVIEPARRVLLVYLDTAIAKGQGLAETRAGLAEGLPALRIGRIGLEGRAAPEGLACAVGCAFCCILSGADGGTITEVEAREMHAALTPLQGQPDGRDWHPRACPALDPETRTCRAYGARPMICRAYVSRDVAACEVIAEGGTAPGAGVIGDYVTYLAAHALARAALAGQAEVATYSLATLAAAAIEGREVQDALDAARHAPKALRDEVGRHGQVIAASRR